MKGRLALLFGSLLLSVALVELVLCPSGVRRRGRSDPDHRSPRSRPFPFPPHTPSRSDIVLRAASRDWFAQPTARSNGGSPPICRANGICGLLPD